MKIEPGAPAILHAIAAAVEAGRKRERAREIGSHMLAAQAEKSRAEAIKWLGKVVGVKG